MTSAAVHSTVGHEAPIADNPLAPVLTETVRELANVHLLHGCEREYAAWLQRELCRARGWTIVDVVTAWHEELDRQAGDRARVGARQAI